MCNINSTMSHEHFQIYNKYYVETSYIIYKQLLELFLT